jgi:hypothetical protein
MLGHKERSFIPSPNISLEELVPADHFYRHLDRVLDLTFVRRWVQDGYAATGRPSKAAAPTWATKPITSWMEANAALS